MQKQPEQQAPVVVKQPETEKAVIAPQPEKPANQMPAEQKKKRTSFVASVINDKADGLNGIGEAVNEKVMMAKAIRNKAKDTDITFKIGKIEILTVRL